MNAKYPGTKGNVHGARKVSNPAKNDGIMSPIMLLLNLQKFLEFWFVEACYDFPVNINHRNSHLP